MNGYKQQGTVLLVSLVLLLVLTIAGIASIRITSLEERMTGNYRNEQVAFHSAEVGILEAEAFVANTNFDLASFTTDCDNGLCFDGSSPVDPGTCTVNATTPWLDQTLWNDASKYREATIVLNGVSQQARYIVEFRCFLPREDDGPLPDPAVLTDWAELFRITVFATGGDEQSRIMLQTTYKKNI